MPTNNYLVVEMQTNNGEMTSLQYVFNSLEEAKSKFHSILAYNYSAQTLDICSVVILNENGAVIASDQYYKG